MKWSEGESPPVSISCSRVHAERQQLFHVVPVRSPQNFLRPALDDLPCVAVLFPGERLRDVLAGSVVVLHGAVIDLGDLAVQCIHTPGHALGHMVLYLPHEQLLFTGDHILFDITPNISIWGNVPHSLEDYLSSLEKIRALSVRAAFPAHRHGEKSIYQRIDELQNHHKERLGEILRTVEEHPGATAYQLAGMITWSARGLGWAQFPPHQKWFAMGETLAHLYFLADEK